MRGMRGWAGFIYSQLRIRSVVGGFIEGAESWPVEEKSSSQLGLCSLVFFFLFKMTVNFVHILWNLLGCFYVTFTKDLTQKFFVLLCLLLPLIFKFLFVKCVNVTVVKLRMICCFIHVLLCISLQYDQIWSVFSATWSRFRSIDRWSVLCICVWGVYWLLGNPCC